MSLIKGQIEHFFLENVRVIFLCEKIEKRVWSTFYSDKQGGNDPVAAREKRLYECTS